MRNRFAILANIFVLSFCIWNLSSGPGLAQNISFRAQVDRNKVSLGSWIRLMLTVEGTSDVSEIKLPDMDGFEVRHVGPSTRVSIVNGQYSSSKTFAYSLLPLKTGALHIPAVSISVGTQTYASEPIDIEVVDTPSAAQDPGQPKSPMLQDRIFLVLKTPKQELYINERLPVKVILFVTDLSVADIHFPELKQVGIDVDTFGQPRQYEQTIGGVRYNVVEFDANVYPTRPGKMTLGPAKLDCNLVGRSSTQRSPFDRQSVFDDDFFNTFFDRYEKQPIVLQSEEVTLNVSPLPQEGRPEDFSGAVGRFEFEASVAPSEVNAGDPLTVKMNVRGDGYLKGIELPAFRHLEEFKVYDPQIKEEDKNKKLEQVIIPESEKILQVPAIRFSSFDPSLGKYQTVSKGPFPVTIRQTDNAQGLKVVGMDRSIDTRPPETLGHDIVFIKDDPGEFYPVGRRFYHAIWFYILVGLCAGLWTVSYVIYMRTHRMQTDIVYARRLLAPRQARHGLRQAKRFKELKQGEEFYTTLFKTLQGYLGNKLHLPPGAVTFSTIQSRLSGPIEAQRIEEIRIAFEECDAVRYAPAKIHEQTLAESYERVERIIDHLERHLK